MTNQTEQRVATVEVRGPVEKYQPDWSPAQRWGVPVTYVTETGERFESFLAPYSRKKDATAAAAAIIVRPVPKNPTALIFEDGEHVGSRTSYSLRGTA